MIQYMDKSDGNYRRCIMENSTAKNVSPIRKNETAKRAKFVELAQNRTRNAIKAIRVIGKLGNKNAYEFSEADVNKIAKALTREVDSMRARMSSTGSKESVDFAL
jgi:hypothetical protein